jgi:hypothetical protein
MTIPNPHIHDHSLSWQRTYTSIKNELTNQKTDGTQDELTKQKTQGTQDELTKQTA